MATISKHAKTTVSTAFGNALGKDAFEVEADYDHLTAYSDIPKDEMPSESDILAGVNAARKTAALAKVKSEEFKRRADAGDNRFKAPTLEDPDVALRTIARALKAQNPAMSDDDATAAAKAVLGR